MKWKSRSVISQEVHDYQIMGYRDLIATKDAEIERLTAKHDEALSAIRATADDLATFASMAKQK